VAREHRRPPDRWSDGDREDRERHAAGNIATRRRQLPIVWHGHVAYRRLSGLAAKQVDVPSWHMTT
jgi:hypothetical protein